MTPYILLAGLVLTLAIGAIFALPHLRQEALEAQERLVADWENTIESKGPLPQYVRELETERAKLERMRAKLKRA